MNLHHVGISVSDLEQSMAFYRRHFGMELAVPVFPFDGPMIEDIQDLPGASGRLGVLRRGDFMLELFEYAAPRPAPKDALHSVGDHGISHFGIMVDGIEALVAAMHSEGVHFHSPIQTFPSGMKAAYGRDPDGNVFELVEQGPAPAR
ncbi:MAG: VOC family protein [Sphingobium sp.]